MEDLDDVDDEDQPRVAYVDTEREGRLARYAAPDADASRGSHGAGPFAGGEAPPAPGEGRQTPGPADRIEGFLFHRNYYYLLLPAMIVAAFVSEPIGRGILLALLFVGALVTNLCWVGMMTLESKRDES